MLSFDISELDVQTVFNQTIPRTIRMKFKEKVKGTDFFPPAVPTDILHKYIVLYISLRGPFGKFVVAS